MIDPQGIRVRLTNPVDTIDESTVFVRLCTQLNQTFSEELTLKAAELLRDQLDAALKDAKRL